MAPIKRIIRNTGAMVYDCTVCGERYIGYGDKDPKLQIWLDRHNNWHTQGIQEAGRHTVSNPPPPWYRRDGREYNYSVEA